MNVMIRISDKCAVNLDQIGAVRWKAVCVNELQAETARDLIIVQDLQVLVGSQWLLVAEDYQAIIQDLLDWHVPKPPVDYEEE